MVRRASIGDAYPPCFYSTESCPQPCTREEYQRCPINPEVGSKMKAESPTEDPETEEFILRARQVREEIRIMSDPLLREITENLRKAHQSKTGLICPQCGDTDHGNRMNKKPWCMKCNLPLMSAEKAAKWVKPQQPKRFNYGPEVDGVTRYRKP